MPEAFFKAPDWGKHHLMPLLSLSVATSLLLTLLFLPSLPPSLSVFQPEYKVADPICTFMFSMFVLCTTVTILRDVFRILMEGISLAAPSDDGWGGGGTKIL